MTAYLAANACYAPLFADSAVASLFDTDATLGAIHRYEVALTRALGDTGAAPAEAVQAALAALDGFRPDMAMLTEAVRSDGMAVPGYMRQLKAAAGPNAKPALHINATSQDVLDTGLALALRALSDLLAPRLVAVIAALDALEAEHGAAPLMGRTWMQAALPVTVGHRVSAWRQPLRRHLERLSPLRCEVELLSYAGPVGLRGGAKGDEIAAHMASALGLGVAERGSHSARDWVVAYGNWLVLVSGALGKIGQDVALMVQQGVDEISLSGGGASSAMPHKQNPVLAGILVALARFTATQQAGLAQALVHEQERSGSAWALEWMILPLMAEATGTALTHAVDLLGRITRIGDPA